MIFIILAHYFIYVNISIRAETANKLPRKASDAL